MKTRKELLALLGDDEKHYLTENVWIEPISTDKGGIHIKAKNLDKTVSFRLWSHYDDIEKALSDDLSFAGIVALIEVLPELEEAIDYKFDIKMPSRNVVQKDVAAAGKIEVYEKIFAEHSKIVFKK